MPFQDDIMREFDRGVADIEGERTRKKRDPLVTEDRDSLTDIFDVGVREIEQLDVKETHLLPAVGRAAATIPPHVLRAGLGMVQRGAERWEGEREEVRGALETVRGVKPPRVKKEIRPLTTDEGIGALLLDIAGKGVEKVGEAVEYVTETGAAKAYKKFRAKSRIAEAMVGGELRPEVMQLIKKGDKESLATAAKMLETKEGFFQSWVGEKAEEHIAKPIAEAAATGGKSLGKMIEKIRPTTQRGSYKYYVTSAIEGVGATMGPALAVSIMTKNPGMGMAVMFPQVFGEVYSEERTGGKGILESSQKAMFYAAAEVLSEGLPLGILTKPGGKLTKKVFKSAGAEGIQEAVNEATQIAYDEGIIDEYTPHHEIGRRLLDAGIIGAIGGGGMAIGTHAFTGKEEDATDKLKKDILDGITETYDKGELDVGRAIDSVMEGYKSGLFDNTDLDMLSKKYPELKDGIRVAKENVKVGVIRDTLVNSIAEGLETGFLEGEPFTGAHAINFIRNGFENDIFTKEDIEGFKERHPELRYELNDLFVEQVVGETAEFEFEPITEPVIEEPEVYAVQDIENIYLGAKARVRVEPATLHEIQERFKERQGREATVKEDEELKRIYEKAKRRSQKRKIFEERRKEKKEPIELKEGETITGRDEKYGIDVELKKDKNGYTLNESDENVPEHKFIITMAGIQKRAGEKKTFILNRDGDFIPAKNIIQMGSNDPSVTPYKPESKDRDAVLALIAKIEFERSSGNMREVDRLESQLSEIITGISVSEVLGKPKKLEEEKAPPKTKEELEAYEPGLPPGAKEVRVGKLEEEPAWKTSREKLISRTESTDAEVGTQRIGEEGYVDQLQRVKIEDIQPTPANKIFAETVEKYKKALPKEKPLLIRDKETGKLTIDDGHHRIEALKELGKTEAEVWVRPSGVQEATHKYQVMQALKSGELSEKEYKKLHEKEYGLITEAELEAWRAEKKEELEVKPEVITELAKPEPIATKEKAVAFGESPHKGWVIFNAPRSMKGHAEWQAEGSNGRFFAAIDPKESNAKNLAQYNMLYGGVQVEYIKEPTMEEALEWWKSGGNKIPTKRKSLDRILTNYKNYLYEQKTIGKEPEIRDPISTILSSKKKAGINYEMEVVVAETGETVTVTKDAGVALRETKEELDKYNKFLECLI